MAVLEAGVTAASQQLRKLAAGGSGASTAGGGTAARMVDELADVVVEQQLLLLECYEALVAELQRVAAGTHTATQKPHPAARRMEQVQALLQRLTDTLLGG